MTKAEKAEMERLRNDLALSRAMRWPDYPVPSPMTYEDINASLVEGGIRYGHRQKVARGWFWGVHLGTFGRKKFSVAYGCSDGSKHAPEGDATTSQNMGRMYRTKLEALQAARIEMTAQCAEALADLDREIAESSE